MIKIKKTTYNIGMNEEIVRKHTPLYAGPIMGVIDRIPRHCETVFRNDECPYIDHGCLGCTTLPTYGILTSGAIVGVTKMMGKLKSEQSKGQTIK